MTNVKHSFELPSYTITWDIPEKNPDCYKSFLLTYKNTEEKVPLQEKKFVFNGWLDNQTYLFDIVALYDNSHKSPPVEHSIITPGPVESLKMTENETTGKADLEWPRPENPDHVPVTYTVEYYGETKTTNHAHLSIPAKFCVTIEVVITVKYDTGVIRSATFNKILYKEPGPVKNIIFAPNDEINSIRVFWDPPDTHLNCASSYSVDVNNKTEIVQSSPFDLMSWEPCDILVTTVTAMNGEGTMGPARSKSYSTPESEISQVTNTNLVVTDKTLNINWEKPERASKCVEKYLVVIKERESEHIISNQEVESYFVFLNDMKACQKLSVSVTPLGRNNAKGDPVTRDADIKPRDPVPLNPLQSVEIDSTFIVFKATFVDDLFVCPLDTLEVTCRDTRDLKKTIQRTLDSIVPYPELTFENILMGNLEPYMKYNCSARVKSYSWSPDSFVQDFQTKEDCE